MAQEEADPPSEQGGINEARAAAKVVIDEWMSQGMLRTFARLLIDRDSGEKHRFGPVIEWAVRLIGEDPMLDHLSVSRITMQRWISGTSTPGPHARMSVLGRIEQLVANRLTS